MCARAHTTIATTEEKPVPEDWKLTLLVDCIGNGDLKIFGYSGLVDLTEMILTVGASNFVWCIGYPAWANLSVIAAGADRRGWAGDWPSEMSSRASAPQPQFGNDCRWTRDGQGGLSARPAAICTPQQQTLCLRQS
jgi:hypothetical protein